MIKKLIVWALLTVFILFFGCAAQNATEKTNQLSEVGSFDGFDPYQANPKLPEDTNSLPSLETVREMYAGKTFSMDDFASLVPGISTSTEIDAITPYYLSTPYAVGNVYQYPEESGKNIYIVCAGTVEAIYLSDSNSFEGSFVFSAMMEDPSLRPPVGRWKN